MAKIMGLLQAGRDQSKVR